MGNQSSSSSSASASAPGPNANANPGSRKKQSKSKLKRGLEKSASVGSELTSTTTTTLSDFQSSILRHEREREREKLQLQQDADANANANSSRDLSSSSSSVPGAASASTSETQNPLDSEDRKFHYNIHHPSDLLQVQSQNQNQNKGLLVKRHSSALEFLSSKSPLRGYLKDKLHLHQTQNQEKEKMDKDKEEKKGESSPGSPGGKGGSNLDKFAKLLAQLSSGGSSEKTARISEEVLQKHLMPHCPLMGGFLWKFLVKKDTSAVNISQGTFVQSTEKIYTLHTDKDQLTFYLRIFGVEKDMVERESFEEFLISAFQLAKVGTELHKATLSWRCYDSYSGKEFIEAVVKSCYHLKDEMSICFLSNWLLTNLPRIHVLMHKYILHQLTTGYSQMTTGNATINKVHEGVVPVSDVNVNTNTRPASESFLMQNPEQLMLELKRIETERTIQEETKAKESQFLDSIHPVLLWLLQSSLPQKFLTVFNPKKPNNMNGAGTATAGNVNMAMAMAQVQNSAQLLSVLQLMHPVNRPEAESWSRLYDSDNDGLSINRFQFHVFNYRGPTLMVVTADNGYSFAIASDTEWKESCHFWGNEESTLLQLQPEFRVVEKGNKLLFANFSIRGYPFGIQAGLDPRHVSLEIKPDFSYAYFKQIPCPILKLTVWGCAPKQTQCAQTEFKKWEAKQCENIRKVNIKSAEWKDNPDKYLLELAGAYRSYDN